MTHYIKVEKQSNVIIKFFAVLLLRNFSYDYFFLGCFWTDSRIGMDCVLEMIAEIMQRAPHIPSPRQKKQSVLWSWSNPQLHTAPLRMVNCSHAEKKKTKRKQYN